MGPRRGRRAALRVQLRHPVPRRNLSIEAWRRPVFLIADLLRQTPGSGRAPQRAGFPAADHHIPTLLSGTMRTPR